MSTSQQQASALHWGRPEVVPVLVWRRQQATTTDLPNAAPQYLNVECSTRRELKQRETERNIGKRSTVAAVTNSYHTQSHIFAPQLLCIAPVSKSFCSAAAKTRNLQYPCKSKHTRTPHLQGSQLPMADSLTPTMT